MLPGYNYLAVSDLGDYSRLRMRWWFTEMGVRQAVASRFLVEYALTYPDYRDSQAYIVDASGKNWGFLFRLNWTF